MNRRCVIAEGTFGDGLAWVIWARRDEPREGHLLTMVKVTDAGGRILHAGGTAGPPLDPGHLLNVSTSGSEEGPRALLARVHPAVRRVALRGRDDVTLNVPVHECPDIPEVRFAFLLLPRDLPLESVAGYGAEDTELERFDLRFQQGRWEECHGQARPGTDSAMPGRQIPAA